MPARHSIRTGELEGYPTVELASQRLAATFVPELNMIAASLRLDGEELLGRRGGLKAYAERGSSMGIPLLHPWANRLERLPWGDSPALKRDPSGLPMHGLLTARGGWTVTGSAADDHFATLLVRFPFGDPELLAAFPFPHALGLELRLEGLRLTITTKLTATGDERVPVAFGWHPYLVRPQGPHELELPVGRQALLDERGIPTGEYDAPRKQDAYDDLFTTAGGEFAIRSRGRRLVVDFEEGYPWAQVYAPEGAGFACFEPMTAPTNALVSGDGLRWVEPGESFSARFAVAVG
jgi:galactose mutarotase-like enzyme